MERTITKKIASNAVALFTEEYQTEFIEIGNLPFYNHHLRQTLTAINMPVVQQPEVYISNPEK